ncbi:MAG: hypothetical protein ABL888_05475 [Pirellulaceae bacterium]
MSVYASFHFADDYPGDNAPTEVIATDVRFGGGFGGIGNGGKGYGVPIAFDVPNLRSFALAVPMSRVRFRPGLPTIIEPFLVSISGRS